MQVAGRAVVERACEHRCGGRHQPLVVQERAAESALIEVVGDDVVRRAGAVEVGVDGQLGGVVVTHGRARGVAAGHVVILLAAIDLILLAVIAVEDVTGAAAGLARPLGDAVGGEHAGRRTGGVGRGDIGLDREWRVGEVAADRRGAAVVGAGRRQRGRGQVHVELLQAGVGRAVLAFLQGLGLGRDGETVDRFAFHGAPQAVEVIEAVVFFVDDHDVVELGVRTGRLGPAGRERHRRSDRATH